MNIDKARLILAELGSVLGEQYAEAVDVVLNDHGTLMGKRNARTGAREQAVLEYMATLPGAPMSPGAVQAALGLDHTPASAMANLADKGRLERFGTRALYRYPAQAVAS
jgi:hypothetical protein